MLQSRINATGPHPTQQKSKLTNSFRVCSASWLGTSGPGLEQDLQVLTQLQWNPHWQTLKGRICYLQCFIRVGNRKDPLFPFHPCKRESDRWPNALSVAFRPLTDDIKTDDLQTDKNRPATTNPQPLPRRPRQTSSGSGYNISHNRAQNIVIIINS